jgi:predicted AlkP superfamily phosphohydrolase/phosphomutase
MGTVDLRGGYGTYTWLTSEPVDKADAKGDIQLVTVQDYDLDGVPDTASGVLRGPPDVFHLPPGQIPGPSDYLTARLTVHVDPEHEAAVIAVGDERVLLAEGEWSGWVPVTFDALPAGLLPIEGMVRFYVKSLRPKLEIYASPVNLSPSNPAMPISSPDDWSAEIRDALGHDFYTQGMPEETNALKDGTFTDDDYVMQVALVQEDTAAVVDLALDRFQAGDMTFVYLSAIDLQCHMLWRHDDPKYPDAPHHPAYDPEVSPRHADDVEGYYRKVDAMVGEVRGRLPEGTVLVVMSDHGFQPFTRKVNLNSWLRDRGYLVLKDGKRTGSIVAEDVDWSKTKAYGVGFNGLYLNLAGREAQGIVAPAEADALLAQLERDLEAFTDPVSGARVVKDAVPGKVAWTGARTAEGPDMVVGYDRPYGASDDTTLGEIPEAIVEDNASRWSGNHLIAPELVPGVLFVDRKLSGDGYDLTDLTASILRHYGVEPAPGMIGTPFF